jgi:hypothetical protein
VVKEVDLKSTAKFARRFEPCGLRLFFNFVGKNAKSAGKLSKLWSVRDFSGESQDRFAAHAQHTQRVVHQYYFYF